MTLFSMKKIIEKHSFATKKCRLTNEYYSHKLFHSTEQG